MFSFKGPPIVKTMEEINFPGYGNNITLQCDIDGFPETSRVYWTRDNTEINTSNTNKYSGSILSEPSLTIIDVAFSDAGVYSCCGVNKYT